MSSILVGRLRRFLALCAFGFLAACASQSEFENTEQLMVNGFPVGEIVEGYGFLEDNGYDLPPVPARFLEGVNRRTEVVYNGSEGPGTIVIDPHAKFLYHVRDGGMAMRYSIAVGREGRSLRNPTTIQRKVEWPGWTPTANMIRREPEVYGQFRGGVPGGLSSPLGARALYLYQGGRDTFYRIHGTNDLGSIGNSGSAGCIRLFNHDIIHLFDEVAMGTRVLIRTYEQSVALEGEELANRGVELPAFIISPDELLADETDATDPAPMADAGFVPVGGATRPFGEL